ncbi:MAG TPA: hypothetical protein VFS05_09805 [Gemmatimonadaceae bacterium]|nr:hypothetical protein [Gemmatimonadaceae bacterium]
MSDREAAMARIRAAFAATPHPGDPFLLGSREGCEPDDEVGPFEGKHDWTALDAAFLDRHGAALSFLSEGGFRYYLPAFLVADLRRELSAADPLFHLVHGFSDSAHEQRVGERAFVVRFGKSAFVNPLRYGAATAYDYARWRLSVFAREEAEAIVAYLRCRRDEADMPHERREIDAALDGFWLERSRSAPTAAELERHLRERAEYVEALRARHGSPGPRAEG